MKKSKKENQRKMPSPKPKPPGLSPKKSARVPANSQGETVDLSALGLADRFNHGRSPYDVEVDKLIADTKASPNPASVGRKFTDVRAMNSLKKRAEIKGVRLEAITLPNDEGFVVRIDPNQGSRPRKGVGSAAGSSGSAAGSPPTEEPATSTGPTETATDGSTAAA